MRMVDELAGKIDSGEALIGVIGLGYVGLPLVQAFVQAGFRAIGFDIDARKVERLNRGESYIGHIPSSWISDRHRAVAEALEAILPGRAEPFAGLICVPTRWMASRYPLLAYV